MNKRSQSLESFGIFGRNIVTKPEVEAGGSLSPRFAFGDVDISAFMFCKDKILPVTSNMSYVGNMMQ